MNTDSHPADTSRRYAYICRVLPSAAALSVPRSFHLPNRQHPPVYTLSPARPVLTAMSSKRGRKRNDNLPPNRARDVQRAFRARRAAHLEVRPSLIVSSSPALLTDTRISLAITPRTLLAGSRAAGLRARRGEQHPPRRPQPPARKPACAGQGSHWKRQTKTVRTSSTLPLHPLLFRARCIGLLFTFCEQPRSYGLAAG